MRIEIHPFQAEHIEDAATLLAARHAADRAHTPELPDRFERADEARAEVAQALARPGTTGVLATRGGRAVGFLLGMMVLPPPDAFWATMLAPRSVEMPYDGYAAAGDDADEVYREMYAALAPGWVAAGCFGHFIEVHAGDPAARAAWFSLGFGRYVTLAARSTAPLPAGDRRPPSLDIERAGRDQIDAVMELVVGLARHHAASPLFSPVPPEYPPLARAYSLELLDDPATAFFLGRRDGRPVALQTFHRQLHAPMARPEPGIYLYEGFTRAEQRGGGAGTMLLRHTLEWAQAEGYAWCTLHYFTANLSGARFWQRSGFRPLTERLARRLDERIAWATGADLSPNPLPS